MKGLEQKFHESITAQDRQEAERRIQRFLHEKVRKTQEYELHLSLSLKIVLEVEINRLLSLAFTCPLCETRLPYTQQTFLGWTQGKNSREERYFCPLCYEYFSEP